MATGSDRPRAKRARFAAVSAAATLSVTLLVAAGSATPLPGPSRQAADARPGVALRSAARAHDHHRRGHGIPGTFLYSGRALEATRAAVRDGSDASVVASYGELVRACRALVPKPGAPWSQSTGPWSVMNKTMTLPPGVDRNEYLSIGIYNHPCNALPSKCKPYPGGHLLPPSECNNKTGLPWEPCDGIRNPPAIDEGDAPRANTMMSSVQHLALGAYLCNETAAECDAWAARAALALRTWYVDAPTRMAPNLWFGQIMPSATPPPKGHGGFIEWTNTAATLDHVELLRVASPNHWPEPSHAAFLAWYGEFLGYMGSKEAAGERGMTNNHGSWFDVMWQGVALTLGNASVASEAANEVTTRRVDTQIKPDGREWIELERANPSGYCEYNLEALTLNADLARNGAVAGAADVWAHRGPQGQSVRLALDWLLPYATGETKWPYSQNSEAPSWGGMFEVLRRASVQFRNETYERAACKVLKGASAAAASAAATKTTPGGASPWSLRPDGHPAPAWAALPGHQGGGGASPVDYTKNLLNLLVPPVFSVTC